MRHGRVLAVADTVVIVVSVGVAYLIRHALVDVAGPLRLEVPVALGILPLWLAVLFLLGCYQPEYQNQSAEAFRRFLAATTVAVLLLGFISFAFGLEISRLFVGLLYVLVLFLGTAVRAAVRSSVQRARAAGRLVQRVLLVGTDREAMDVAVAMGREGSGYRVVGFIDDDRAVGELVAGDVAVVGTTADVLGTATALGAGLVVISPTGVSPGTLGKIAITLEGSSVDVAVAPSLFEVVTRRVVLESIAHVPILHVEQIRLVRWKAYSKRLLDVVGSSVLLLFLSPLALVAAVAIAWHDGSPVLFRQTRVGKDGSVFTMFKFRTMVRDAEDLRSDVAALNEVGHIFFKVREDPRVTPVGRLLRRWSIDELPQLWNVLRGDMSLVGPRPALPEEVALYEPWHMRRLRVKPGVTGIWQVSGRSNVPFDEAVRMDLFYIENWSLGQDLYLIAKTVRAVLGRYGAY